MEGEGASNLLLYVARVLRGQLDDLLTCSAEAPGLLTTLKFAAQHILVSQDATSRNLLHSGRDSQKLHAGSSSKKPRKSNPWENLPPQMLHLILPRLRLPQLKSLRLLSKEWKASLDTPDPAFSETFHEVSTTRFALVFPVSTLDSREKFWVCAYDLRANKWYHARYTAPNDSHGVTICACEGGLLYFMFFSRELSMGTSCGFQQYVRLVIWNPLTGDQDELPKLNVDGVDTYLKAVQLSVDRERRQYKVVAVSMRGRNCNDPAGFHWVCVYDSETKDWKPLDECFLGYSYRCSRDSLMQQLPTGLWSYEAANNWLRQVTVENSAVGTALVLSMAMAGKSLYFLYKEESMELEEYGIGELCYPHGAFPLNGRSINGKQLDCPPLNDLPKGEHRLKLHACREFLMVSAVTKNLADLYQQQRHWLCDLATESWRELPALPEGKVFTTEHDVMCELQWSVIPKTKPGAYSETSHGRMRVNHGY